MISEQQEREILSLAYVPEHIPKLMCFLSQADVELIDNNYLLFIGENWFIFIAYPLIESFNIDKIALHVNYALKLHKPKFAWILTQKLPESLNKKFKKIEDDWYFRLDIPAKIERKLIKTVEKATKNLRVSFDKNFTPQHKVLIEEFLENKVLTENVRQLYIKIPYYVENSDTAFFLNAYDKRDNLTAFYVVEMAAYSFSGYIIGCTSKKNYVPHSSDLLMFELIKLSENQKKRFINLGIGVNEGIRRFKEKWGGVPFLKYETYEYSSTNRIFDYFLIK